MFSRKSVNSSNTSDYRLVALSRFAVAISILTIIGHQFLGFEQSWAQVFVALGTAYFVEFLLENVHSISLQERPRFIPPLSSNCSRVRAMINFFLPAHITGLAVAMLIYGGNRFSVFLFAATIAIASKRIMRTGTRHVLNPSNFGISITLLLFPSVGIAPPYQFTENLYGIGDWIVPLVLLTSGLILNGRLTKRLPVIAGWVSGFILQAMARSAWGETSLVAALGPATGVAFLLFSCYMVTDPATTPVKRLDQLTFGLSIGLVYGLLTTLHVPFGFFFSLTIVCLCRWVKSVASMSSFARVIFFRREGLEPTE